MTRSGGFLLVLLLAVAGRSSASMVMPLATEEHLRLADAICRGTVVGTECFKDPASGHIFTRTRVRVDEAFKGRFPVAVSLVHRGGCVGHEGDDNGLNPQFGVGEERLLFLARRPDGTLFTLQGAVSAIKLVRDGNSLKPAHDALLRDVRAKASGLAETGVDVSDQAASSLVTAPFSPTASGAQASPAPDGLLVDGAGVAARFVSPDRGEPVPYLVDASALPTGISQADALTAVEQALAAWSAVSTVRFTFEGLQSFGMSAADVQANDGKLRIQLHDLYNEIPSGSVLGIGGRAYNSASASAGGWGLGGNVAGREFHKSIAGYIVLKHTSATMRNLATFTEVLCHEVGHSLGMAHSSETSGESNTTLREAMMYYLAHADGRGATLGAYDPPVIRQVHPLGNTPPYSYDRVLDVVTAPFSAPNVSGINELEARGYDLQSANVTIQTTGASANGAGTFSVVGNRIRFTPAGFINAPRLNPAGTSFYERIYVRYSDGTNASPLALFRVIALLTDEYPEFPDDSDGVPDGWMTANFGSPDPTDGPNREPDADFDGDGFSNLKEYILGSDPKAAGSNLRITSVGLHGLQFQAKPYELYEVYGSTNLTTWRRVINPILPTSAVAAATGFTNAAGAHQFLRVLKVP